MGCDHEGLEHKEYRLKRDDLEFVGVHLGSAQDDNVLLDLYQNCAGVYFIATVHGEAQDAAPFPTAGSLVTSLLLQGRAMAEADGGALLSIYEALLESASKKNAEIAEAMKAAKGA
jgi:hypothetical protein